MPLAMFIWKHLQCINVCFIMILGGEVCSSLTLTDQLAHPIPLQYLTWEFGDFWNRFCGEIQKFSTCLLAFYTSNNLFASPAKIAKHCIIDSNRTPGGENLENFTAGKKDSWLVAGWERYEGAFSPVPEEYGWANGNYFEAQRGRWVVRCFL